MTSPALSNIGFPLLPEVLRTTWRPRGDHRQVLNLKTCEMQHPEADFLLAELLTTVSPRHVRDYPYYSGLLTKLAELDGVKPEQIALTAGSAAAIGLIVDAFGIPAGNLIFQEPVFDSWTHHATLRGLLARHCAGIASVGWTVVTDELVEAMSESSPAVVTLTNPGNPCGSVMPPERIAALADCAAEYGHLLVVDECYGAFSGTNHVPLIRGRDNMLVIRSLSKSWALAGARLAVVFGPAVLIDYVRRFRGDSTVSAITVALATGLADRLPKLRELWADVVAIRDGFAARLLEDHPDWVVLPSGANFVAVIAGPPGTGTRIERALAAQGVRIRGLDDVAGLHGGFRVSMAGRDAMAEVAVMLREMR